MKLGLSLGVAFAVFLHVGFLLFGGLLLPDKETDPGTLQQVELISAEDAREEEKKPEETAAEKSEEMDSDAEQPPDAAEMMRNLDLSEAAQAPALEALSLSAIEAALNGQGGGGGDFAQSVDFASGGSIGGTGKAGVLGESMDSAFSLTEIDQQPRAIFQASASYPAALRGKKIEGVVSILFVVDPDGKVVRPQVEKSTHAAFEKPALDAVKQWKFEPAVKGGQRVHCKMRVPIRFQPNRES
ncbi:MAG: energy transducer TonB [Planctomycetota bacterium]